MYSVTSRSRMLMSIANGLAPLLMAGTVALRASGAPFSNGLCAMLVR